MAEASYDWCPALASILAEQAENEGIKSLTGPERILLLAYAAWGLIGNGGFQCFYENQSDMEDVVAAFTALGMTKTASYCRDSMKVFPKGKPIKDDAKRETWMNDNEDKVLNWMALVQVYLTDEWSAIDTHAARYIRDNLKQFKSLKVVDDD